MIIVNWHQNDCDDVTFVLIRMIFGANIEDCMQRPPRVIVISYLCGNFLVCLIPILIQMIIVNGHYGGLCLTFVIIRTIFGANIEDCMRRPPRVIVPHR